jgi:hypothetical protein
VTSSSVARAVVLGLVVLGAAAVACSSASSDSSSGSGYCDVTKKANGGACADPGSCDTAIGKACKDLAEVLSPTTIAQAQGCLESGVCGVASCLSRAQKGAQPTGAHKTLAANFCQFCAPNVQDCEAQFYAKNSKLPGSIVLPYSADVAKAVDDACTGNDGCQASFRTCATGAIQQALADALDPEVAECVVSGFTKDDGEQTGPDGKPKVTTCTPQNCKGCCRDDKCENGDAPSACGVGAAACQICAGGQKCTDGKCKEPCSPNTCAGCCDGDNCLPGTTKDKCGDNGAACAACGGAFVCSKQTCIDGSCQATCTNGCCAGSTCKPGTAVDACGVGGEACVDCGFGRKCTSGACVIDPNALWDFYVSFAVLPETNKSGGSWDPLNGAPDPYLIAYSSVTGSTHSGTTKAQMDSTIPFWAETPLVGIKASELLNNLSFEVWDQDPDFDDYVGGCKIPVVPAIFDGSLQSYVCAATASGVEVKLYYRINPHKP